MVCFPQHPVLPPKLWRKAMARVMKLVGIELITIEARIVIASVETYLKYAEAVGLTASAAAPA
jgi:hypothetical protein